MSDLRLGVIGAGIMGTDHAHIAHRLVSGARVVAVADVDRPRAETLAGELGDTLVAPSAEALIDDDGVDAVVVASHDATHAGLTLAAIAAGKPVLCEKPLAPTAEAGRRVVEAEETAGRRLVSVGFMRRFDPAHVELHRAVAGGSIGRVVLLNATSRGVAAGPGATSDSSLTNSAIHEFDTVPWLLDSPIVEIRWFAPRSAVDGMDDPQVMLARTAGDTLVTIETFLNARYGYDIRCEAVGTAGAVALATAAHTVTTSSLRRETSYPSDWRPRFADAYRIELQAWVDAVRAGDPPPLADARAGLRATLVAEAAIASMRSGGDPLRIPS
jgi:myo-inositol 2-dehydrogenase/D-chiro-inositol 1-dehydrogenase